MLLAAEDPNVNADFYIVAATVIPIYLIALALQTSLWRITSDAMAAVILRKPMRTNRDVLWRALVAQLPSIVVSIIVIFSTGGELFAIKTLYNRNDKEGWTVLVTLIVLATTTGIWLVYAFIPGIFSSFDRRYEEKYGEPPVYP